MKVASIARNVVTCLLIDKLSRVPDRFGDRHLLLKATLAYTFSAPVLPPYVFKELQTAVQQVIAALEEPKSISSWVHVSQNYKEPIIRLLKSWQQVNLKSLKLERVPTHLKATHGPNHLVLHVMTAQQANIRAESCHNVLRSATPHNESEHAQTATLLQHASFC